MLLGSGCIGRYNNAQRKSQSKISPDWYMLILHEHQMKNDIQESKPTANYSWCNITNITKLLYTYTWSWTASLKDKMSSRDISGEPLCSTNTNPCDTRLCFTHFPWGTAGCQLSFHCVPLQYLMVHFLKPIILERKKQWPLAKRRSARLNILKDIISSTNNIHFDLKEINNISCND